MLQRVKIGYRAFCEETSIHGFIELYRAKYLFWRIIWLVLLLGAIGVTGFQLYGSVNQYINQGSIITVESATENDIVYPPLKYCIAHWLLWFDITDLRSMSNGALIYSLSFLNNNIHTVTWFNTSKAKAELNAYLTMRNYTFEKYFTQNARIVTNEVPGYDPFHGRELSYFNNNVYMCYMFNEADIRNSGWMKSNKVFKFQIDQKNELDNLLNNGKFFMSKVDLFYTLQKYCALILIDDLFKCWNLPDLENALQNKTVSAGDFYKLATRFDHRPTEYLLVDGYNNREVGLRHKGSEYSTQIKLSVQKLQPNDAIKCNPDAKTFHQVDFCEAKCYEISFPGYYYHENKSLTSPCKKLHKFILLGEKGYKFDDVCGNNIDGIPDYTPLKETNTERIDPEIQKNCMKECNGGCYKWGWEIFSSITEFGRNEYASTNIKIQYPTITSTTVFKESDMKTWQDFVGNVGGLLGIWTGASILSLFQLIYLFCCPPELQSRDKTILISKTKFKLPVTLKSKHFSEKQCTMKESKV